jgi:nucleotidyltransferase substrate binding protein (TIGR01987 family)
MKSIAKAPAMKLDFTPLQHALEQLSESLSYLNSDLAQDPKLFRQFRAASIQAFEYSYELSWKSAKRFLQHSSASVQMIDEMSFPELIRTAYEAGLLRHSWSKWRIYREARNASSHAYSEKVAEAVLQNIPSFLEEAQFLCAILMEKTDD